MLLMILRLSGRPTGVCFLCEHVTINGQEEDPKRRGRERTAITVPIPETLAETTVTSQLRQALSESMRSFGTTEHGKLTVRVIEHRQSLLVI